MPTTSDTTGPRLVGRYELLEQLGAGGMGVVYRARDPLLDRVVAVKLPLFEGPPEQRARRVQRFQREARAIAKVAHPHVCAIYDVGEQDGQPFVVMAYLPGPSLAERLKNAGRFEQVGEAVQVAQQVLAALGAVHAHGIIHRDVKPGNILFDADGKVVLTDFGLARPEDAEALTSEGVALGTPAYMAPEQAAGQLDRVGPWTDLYAVGVVLYQMVTGRLPFEGPPLSVLPRSVHEEPPRPSQFRPDLPAAVEAVILRALRKEPGERFQDAEQFAAALGAMDAVAARSSPIPPVAEQSAATTITSVRPTTGRAGARTKIALAVVAIAALLGTLVLLWQALIHNGEGSRSQMPAKASPVTWDNYTKVKPGMAEWEVGDILGPGEVQKQEVWDFKTPGGLHTYKVLGYGSATARVTMTFLDGKVTSKLQEGLVGN